MIGSLRGTVIDQLGDTEVLLDVHGVGYRVTVSPTTVVQLRDDTTDGDGDSVFLHVHHHIREDAQTLYGFRHRDGIQEHAKQFNASRPGFLSCHRCNWLKYERHSQVLPYENLLHLLRK